MSGWSEVLGLLPDLSSETSINFHRMVGRTDGCSMLSTGFSLCTSWFTHVLYSLRGFLGKTLQCVCERIFFVLFWVQQSPSVPLQEAKVDEDDVADAVEVAIEVGRGCQRKPMPSMFQWVFDGFCIYIF